MSALSASLPNRHPWLDSFVASPLEHLTQLISGRAAIYPFSRADSVDAARMLFGGLAPDDSARIALSGAILEWLDVARTLRPSAEPPVQQRDLRRIADMFEITGTLELEGAAEQLRRQYVRWWAWVDGLPRRSARDPRAAYLRMLANTQACLRERFDDPDGLSPLWLRICADAGRSLPDSYLNLGLAGLRKLPQAANRGDSPWITGVAEWALANDPTAEQFLDVWRPLKRLYPSSRALLRRQVNSLLSQPAFNKAGVEPPGWWGADAEFPHHQDPARPSFEPPARDLHEGLIEALKGGRPFRMLEGRLKQLLEAHRLYASRSGDSDFLVKTFCNVGQKLIESGTDAHEERIRMAEMLARETLNHRPFHIYAWSLWRDALAAGGAYDSARDLGWEIVRRFPNDPVPRNVLAELMIEGGESSEALKLVKISIEDDVFDPFTFALLTRLEAARGNLTEAHSAALKMADLQPGDLRASLMLERIKSGKFPSLESSHIRIGAKVKGIDEGPAIEENTKSGRLRSLRETLRSDASAIDKLKANLQEDPNSTYVNLLAARYGLWRVEENTLPSVAAAFELALADEDRAKLERLAERAPRLIALIHLARALFGDEESAEYIQRLLQTEDGRSLVEGERILKPRLEPVLQDINRGAAAVKAIGDHRLRVLHALNDANEALAAPELLAA